MTKSPESIEARMRKIERDELRPLRLRHRGQTVAREQ
jgi:hypothetical protein